MSRALFLATWFVLAPAAALLAQPAGDPWNVPELDRSALERALAEKQEAARAIPESEKPESEAGQRKAALKARAGLLAELLAALDRQARAAAVRAELPAVDAVKREAEALDAETFPALPEKPDIAGFERLRADRDAALAQQRAREAELEAVKKRLASAAERVAAARRRASEARASVDTQTTALAAIPPDSPGRSAKVEALRGVRLLARTAEESIRALEAEEAADRAMQPVLSLQAELARKRVARLDKQVDEYQDALRILLESEQDKRKREVARARKALANAKVPANQFLARLRLDHAEKNLTLAMLNARKARTSRILTVQEAHKEFDRVRIEGRLDLVARTSDARAASDLLKKVNASILDRRQELAAIRLDKTLKDEDSLLQLQLEIEDELLALEERWDEKINQAMEGLPFYEEAPKRLEAGRLRDQYRKLLREEIKPVLDQLRREQEKLAKVIEEHRELLDETRTRIRARFLWYRDAPVLGAETFRQAAGEIGVLPARLSSSIGAVTEDRESAVRSPVEVVVAGIIILAVLPAGIILLRRRLFRLHARLLEAKGRSAAPRVRLLLLGLLRMLVAPAYAYALAALLGFADLPATSNLFAGTGLVYLGHALLLLSFARVFFGPSGIAIRLFGMLEDTARTIRRAALFVLLSVAFLFPWAVLRQDPPFAYLAVPRIAYTLFELCALVAVIILVRQGSPFMRDLVRRTRSANVRRLWRAIGWIAIAIATASVALDVLGHRNVAFEVAARLVISLVAVFVLVSLFITIAPRIDEVLRRRVGKLTSAPGAQASASAWEFGRQLRQFLSGLLGVVLLILFARLWGLDRQALAALDHIPLYTVATTDEGRAIVASAGDLASCLIIFAITVWLLKYLSGIFELLLFPRVRWDAGLRYAVLSISRYVIGFIGIVVALGAIHLNIGRLGWLMAAIGLGLGFGLQEIVSNFVSGIILLVERPIRVGDIVTIGDMSGVVTRINIRATTVRNWDRQEVVLPNKDLITKQVTNWTLTDPITRVTVKIGVAYGSDLDLVRKVLAQIVAEQPEVLKEPEPMVLFMQHGDSSLDFEIRVFLSQTDQRMPLLDRMNTAVNRRLAAHGIEIPFPQRDLHIRTPAGATAVTSPLAAAGVTGEPESGALAGEASGPAGDEYGGEDQARC